MNVKVFKYMLCMLLSLSVALLSGCERIRGLGMTDEMVAPPDTATMPMLIGCVYISLALNENSSKMEESEIPNCQLIITT
jgi:hypothetical protein